jgi:hypothetical protein
VNDRHFKQAREAVDAQGASHWVLHLLWSSTQPLLPLLLLFCRRSMLLPFQALWLSTHAAARLAA